MSGKTGVALLAGFVKLQERLASATTLHEVNHVVLSDMRALVGADTALLCAMRNHRLEFMAASDTSSVEKGSVFIQSILETLGVLTASGKDDTLRFAARDDEAGVRPAEKASEATIGILPIEWFGKRWGYVLYFFAEPLDDNTAAALQRVHEFCRIAYRPFVQKSPLDRWRDMPLKKRRIIILLLVGFFLFPVRLSVVGRAEVIADKPDIVAAPISGIVKEIHVSAAQKINAGELLVSFEKAELEAQLEVANKAVEVARAELLKASDESLSCIECRHRIPQLEQQFQQRTREAELVARRLERAAVYADVPGVVMIGDRERLLGRYVELGERLLYVADPEKTALKIKIALDDFIDFRTGETPLRFFPSTNPLNSFPATVSAIAYEPVTNGPETFYVIYAQFPEDQLPELGLRGSARVSTHRVPLFYYLMRKPLGWLRATVGI